jgi:predicted ATPase/signal transduction histidine kinase/GAF domain-containing protein
MTDLSGYVFEILRVGREYTLHRARRAGDDASVLVLAPVRAQQTPANLRRLEHEYSLVRELDPAWAVRPRALVQHDGRNVLVLEDPGGDLLDRMLERPLEPSISLRIALSLTAALRQMHRRGLIHKHVRPANVLVDAAGRARLTGFGLASRLPRERQPPAPPEIIAGTFAYMAPEQTGRMNRSIDARSDLYSLGVTLYEMLTGTLPFTASEPIEWIHCHIARQPTPPSERVNGIPPPLEAIVMKLLAKMAEDRYQTAAGVEADLRTCLTEWEAHGRIDAFPLATGDASDRLLIPEKLYGREAEIDALVAAFDRVVTHGISELVLVSGYAGIGKSAIVSELHKVLVPLHGLFAVGKFDQYKRDIPYATLAQAFQGLVRQLLSKNDAELGRWRSALMQALGSNGQLMVNLIPELALVIGEQPAVPDAPPRDAQNRFQLVFQRFLDVFARPEHPLVLFLDDLQWLDTATLELLRHLVVAPEVRHLLIVGAYRDNEVGPSHPLMRTLRMIGDAGGKVRAIELAALTLDDVARFIADALRVESDHVRPLAELVFEKTGGNPFFVIQFVTALADEGLLTFDPDAAAWRWNLHRIRAKGITDNVVELMAGKVSRLPGPALRVLKQLACLGTSAQTGTLSMVLGAREEEVHAAFWDVVRSGLVLLRDGAYAFLHDRVQEAVYALIPEAERAATHLRIGRVLASRTAPAEFEGTIFEIVHQLDRGAALIDSPAERDRVAAFNLTAGTRAKASTAYASALTYFTAGRMLLEPDGWARNHRMTFDLELHCAECEFLTGDLAAAEQRLSALSEHAASLVDRAAVTRLRLALYTTLDRSDRAIEVGLAYLRHAGVEWSRHPTDEDVRNEYERTRRLLARRPLEQMLDSPLMSDIDWRATMDVLADLMPPLLFTAGDLHDLALLRMANISLERGHCDGSCYAYARLMQVLGTRFADYQTAFRFGQLACDLVDRRGLDRFKARVYMCFGIYVICWFQHLATSRVWIARALDAANASGDLTFAIYASKHLTTNLLVSGEPLGDVEREIERGLAFARKAKFGLVIDAFIGQLMMIRSLRGLPPDVITPDDVGHGEGWFEQHLAQSPHLALPTCWYWIHKLQTCFFARDHVGGLAAAAKAADLLWSSRASLELAEYHLYAALVRAAACDAAPADSRPGHLEALFDHHRQIMVWAENSPENFENRAALVGAEIARLQGRELDAQRLYEQAIHSAREHGFIQNEGLSHELAGRFYGARGFRTIADVYLRNARSCYLRWGADGKVHQLDEMHPQLQPEPISLRSDGGTATSVEHLDLATVINVSQAVSGEIDLKALIDTLMVTALEHAGGDRGLLILPRGEQLLIEAQARTVSDTIEVDHRPAPISSVELPESVLRYAVRTLDSLLLDDASDNNPFSDDEYIRRNHSRSILCLPLVKQAKLIGVLYLENRQASHVFTRDRIAVLKLLASQAAISLENARLYSELQHTEAYLAEAQRLSHTGSFGWSVASGEIFWSKETFQIYEFDPPTVPPSNEIIARIHPDDVDIVRQLIETALRSGQDWEWEHRLMMPDGRVKSIHVVAQAVRDELGELEFVGAVMDVTASKQAQEALHRAQAELAHVTRVTTLGELMASIAHEVNQPLAAIVTNGEASLRWLNRPRPEIDQVRGGLEQMIGDAERASNVVYRVRALSKKIEPNQVPLDVNDVLNEVIKLVDREILSHQIALRVELAPDLPPVLGDRVQLQQVVINLVVNGIQAMAGVDHRGRNLLIRSERRSDDVLVLVQDSGNGIDTENANRLFDAFYTTKPGGMGMGLSICRSIVQAHGGRVWASNHGGEGAVFQFTLPAHRDTASSL